MATRTRVNVYISQRVWDEARAKAAEEGAVFADDLADLIGFYADHDIDVDPRADPIADETRMGHAIHVVSQDWREATRRAEREHNVSGSVLTECLLKRYAQGDLRLERTVVVVEMPGAPHRRSEKEPAFRGLGGANLKVAQALVEQAGQTAKDLAGATGYTVQAVGVALGYLQQNGLATFGDRTAEGRRWELTPKAFQEDSGEVEVRPVRAAPSRQMLLKVARALEENPNQTIKEIAESAGCSHSSASQVTQYMSAHGLAARTGNTWARTSKDIAGEPLFRLRGAKLKVFNALEERPNQTTEDLRESTSHSPDAVAKAVRYLSERGLAVRTGKTWALTLKTLKALGETTDEEQS